MRTAKRMAAFIIFVMLLPVHATTAQSDANKPTPSDWQIARDVEQALKREVFLRDEQISVHVTVGRVTLKGEVERYFCRRDAEKIAESIDGVTEVRNELEIESAFKSTYEIKQELREAIRKNPLLRSSEIDIETSRSDIVLTGVVETEIERRQADRLIRDVAQSNRVKNE